jgi:hypothetical protein
MSAAVSLGKSLGGGPSPAWQKPGRPPARDPAGRYMHVTAIAGQICRRVDAVKYLMETNGG